MPSTDADGMRPTSCATNTPTVGREPRHHQRARAEYRIRVARVTGLRTVPCTTPRRA